MSEASAEGRVDSQPETRRGRRRVRVGVVTSDRRDKTIRVAVEMLIRHRRYGKYVRRWTVLHAHDERNEAREGDRVEVMECRPYSKTKHWRLVRVLERQAEPAAATSEQVQQ